MVDEHFDALDYADDDLNRQAIKLIREGIKKTLSVLLNSILKDDKPLHEKNDIYYYSFKGTHYKKECILHY